MRLIKTGLKQISAWAAITHLSTKMAGFARRSLLGIKYSGLVAICSPKQKHNKLIFLSSKMSFIRSIRRKHGFPNRAIIITAKLIYFTTHTFFSICSSRILQRMSDFRQEYYTDVNQCQIVIRNKSGWAHSVMDKNGGHCSLECRE